VFPDGIERPVSARQVAVEVEVDTPNDPQRGGWVPVAADGSYRVSGVPDNRFVKIASVDTTGLRYVQYQLCGTNTVTHGDTTLDVRLFLPGAALPGRMFSGRVSALIEGQQRPLPGVDVYYQSRAYGPDVLAGTDRDGRYSLCGIPAMPGTLYMFCRNDEQPFRQAIDIRGDEIFDIDATSFYRCL
jgi:hypothetical protein